MIPLFPNKSVILSAIASTFSPSGMATYVNLYEEACRVTAFFFEGSTVQAALKPLSKDVRNISICGAMGKSFFDLMASVQAKRGSFFDVKNFEKHAGIEGWQGLAKKLSVMFRGLGLARGEGSVFWKWGSRLGLVSDLLSLSLPYPSIPVRSGWLEKCDKETQERLWSLNCRISYLTLVGSVLLKFGDLFASWVDSSPLKRVVSVGKFGCACVDVFAKFYDGYIKYK